MTSDDTPAPPPYVFLIEDNVDLQRTYMQLLGQAGYLTTACTTLSAAKKAICGQVFDLIILDWSLPDGNGKEILDLCRSELDIPTSIIVVTGFNQETDVVNVLRMGADDYITKPFKNEVLMARCEAVLRRTSNQGWKDISSRPIEFPPYTLDEASRQISIKGKPVKMTAKEYQLAKLFFSHIGKLYSRSELLESVWGVSSDIDTRTVDAHIGKLRRKLQLSVENGWRLTTAHGYGYRLERLPPFKAAQS